MTTVCLISGALGGIGLVGLIYKKTMLGLIISIQFMLLGGATFFVLSGAESGAPLDGHAFAVFIILCGLAQTVAGYALATRMFYLRNKTGVEELRGLKR